MSTDRSTPPTALRPLTALLLSAIAAIILLPSLSTAQYIVEKVPGGAGELRFLSPAEGFSFTDNSVKYTSDSGYTWSTVAANVKGVTGCSGMFDAAFVDRNTGWILVYYGGGINTPIDTTRIYATTDGGKSWRMQRESPVSQIKWASQTFNAIRFVDAMNGWAMGLGIIEHTTDGGNTWTTQLRWSERTIYNDLFTSGYFLNRNEGWIAGYGSFVLHTTNGGATWETQHVDSATAENGAMLHPDTYCLLSIHFSDPLNGCAATRNGFYLHTRDGGVTWEKGSTGFPNDNIDVYMRDANTMWQVGGSYCDNTGCYAGQSILYTRDGGATWTPIIATTLGLLGAGPEFTSIAWSTPRLGYISNEYGELFRIRDTSAVVAGIEPAPADIFNLYPNPVAGELTLRFADAAAQREVTIYDALGRRAIFTSLGPEREARISTAGLGAGSYTVEVTAGTARERRRIVVVR